jgi:hypothetical protein
MSVDALQEELARMGCSTGTTPVIKVEGYYLPSKGKYTIPYTTRAGKQVYRAPVRDNVFVAPCWSNGKEIAALLKGQAVSYLQAAVPVSSHSKRQALNKTATLVLLQEIETHLGEHPDGGYFISSLFGGQYLTVIRRQEGRDFDAEVDCI